MRSRGTKCRRNPGHAVSARRRQARNATAFSAMFTTPLQQLDLRRVGYQHMRLVVVLVGRLAVGEKHDLHPSCHTVNPQLLADHARFKIARSEEHTSELQSLMRISYAVFCLQKTKQHQTNRKPPVH